MNKLSSEHEYQLLLKAISDSANELINACSIYSYSKALISKHNGYLKEIYPFIKNLSSELEYFYDVQVGTPPKINNPVVLSYHLINGISHALDCDNAFASLSLGDSLEDIMLPEEIDKFIEYSNTISNPREKEKFDIWLAGFIDVTAKLAEVKIENEKEAAYYTIVDNNLGMKLAKDICPKKVDFDTFSQQNIDFINSAIYEYNISLLNDFCSDEEDTMKDENLINSLKSLGVPIKESKMNKIVEEIHSFCEDIAINSNDYFSLTTHHRYLKSKQNEFDLKGNLSNLENLIFEQRIKTIPHYISDNIYDSIRDEKLDSEHFSKTTEEKLDFNHADGINYIKQKKAKELLENYENTKNISADPELTAGLQTLVSMSVASLLDNKHSNDGSILSKLHQDLIILSGIPVIDEETREDVSGFIDDVKSVLSIADAAERFYGIKLYEAHINPTLLDEIKSQPEINESDFDIITDFFMDFSKNLFDGSSEKIISMSPDQSVIGNNIGILDRVKDRSESLEKFQTLDFIYNGFQIVLQNSETVDNYYKDLAIYKLQETCEKPIDQLAKKMDLMQDFFPEINDPAELAEEIHWLASEEVLLPFALKSEEVEIDGQEIINELGHIKDYSKECLEALGSQTTKLISSSLDSISERKANDPDFALKLEFLGEKIEINGKVVNTISKEVDKSLSELNESAHYNEKITRLKQNLPDSGMQSFSRSLLLKKGLGYN